MANQIRLKRASGSDPGASDLVLGEPAVRTDTGEIFLKKDDGSIAKVAGGIDDGDKGDITVSNDGGTFTIDAGVITNAKVSSSAAIAGSKISPNFGSQNVVTTGTLGSDDITITGGQPALSFIDDGQNPDYKIYNNNGTLRLYDITNTADRLVVNTDGHVDVTGNLDVGAGLDVTGNAIIDAVKVGAWSGNSTYKGIFHSSQSSSEYMVISNDTHTFISATSGSNVYIRNGGNDSTNQLIVGSGNDALTWRGNKVFHAGNDGAGSGLDADSVDGIAGSSFLRSDATDSASGALTFTGGLTTNLTSISNGILELKAAIATSHTLTADYNALAVDPTINNGVTVTVPSGAVWAIV